MLGKIVVVLSLLALARAQLPNLGWCPEYVPMANFDMSKFLGTWYEAERYFQLSEIVSRCVMANYTRGTDGRFRVSNEVTNRFTGVKRVLDGEIKPSASKAEEGKLYVKYTTLPLTPETQYSVLETDYKSYAVLWSCSGFGPVHTQNAWIMTRQRLAPGEVLQKAYGVLDKYKISKTFFVKTDQDDCVLLANLPNNPPATEQAQSDQAEEEGVEEEARNVVKAEVPVVAKIAAVPKVPEAPVVPVVEVVPESPAILRSAAVPEVVPEVSVVPMVPGVPAVPETPTVQEVPLKSIKEVPSVPETVPEVILKVAHNTKEVVEAAIQKIEDAPKEDLKKEDLKKEEIIVEAERIVG